MLVQAKMDCTDFHIMGVEVVSRAIGKAYRRKGLVFGSHIHKCSDWKNAWTKMKNQKPFTG